MFVQGYSGVTGNVAASGQYGATIKNVTMIVENKKYSGQLKAYAVNRSGNVKFVVTDSRGFTAQKEIYIKVIPYYFPKVTAKAYRCGADGAANEGGQYLKIEATVDFASVAGKNKAEIYYQYMEENAANVAKLDMLGIVDVPGGTLVSDPLLEGTFDRGKNFGVRVIVVDCIKSVKTGYMKVPKEAVYLDKPAGGEHIGVGGYCDTEHGPLADVHWNTRVRKGLLLGYGVGSVYISVVADSPAADFGGTWEQITENVPSGIFMWKKTE